VIPKVDTKGCNNVQAASGMFDEDEEEEEEEIPLIHKNNRYIEAATGVAIFPPKICRHLPVFRGFRYQILIKHWKRSFLKTYYQSLLKLTSQPSVQRS
jgi:hypothetical protein